MIFWNWYEATFGSNISRREGTFFGGLWFALKRTEKETSSPKTFSPKNSLGTNGFAPQKEVSPRQHSRCCRKAVSSVSRDSSTPLLPPSPDRPRRRAAGGRGSSSLGGASQRRRRRRPRHRRRKRRHRGRETEANPGGEGGTGDESNDTAGRMSQ